MFRRIYIRKLNSLLFFTLFLIYDCGNLLNIKPITTSQSSTFSKYTSDRAVDGNLSTCCIAGIGSGSNELAWWKADLGQIYSLSMVSLLNSPNDYEAQYMNYFSIFVQMANPSSAANHNNQEQLCYQFIELYSVAKGNRVDLNCASNPQLPYGRYVIIRRFSGGFRQDAFSICDIEFYVLWTGQQSNALISSEPRQDITTFMPQRDIPSKVPQLIKPVACETSSIFSTNYCNLTYDGSSSTCMVIGVGSNSLEFGWFQINLGKNYIVNSVELLNNLEEYESLFLSDVSIYVSPSSIEPPQNDIQASLCCSIGSAPVSPGATMNQTCSLSNKPGRYVTLIRTGGFRHDAISVCEIKIKGFQVNQSNDPNSQNLLTSTSSQIKTYPIESTLQVKTDLQTTNFITTIKPKLAFKSCQVGNFQCLNSGLCIKQTFVCDGFNDCLDFSDELNCTCSQNQFICKNSRCIPSVWVCDNDNDCGDNSDELKCSIGNSNGVLVASSCQADQFRCDNGECILGVKQCDGYPDCRDYSDETLCVCKTGELKCNVTGFCIQSVNICNQIRDCPDNSDEINCNCRDYEYRCEKGNCIYKEWLCDGVNDCPMGDDENITNCNLCGNNQFRCMKGSCLNTTLRCNGVYDCPLDYSDEFNCIQFNSTATNSIVPELLLATLGGLNGLPFCSNNWNNYWSNRTCKYLGYDSALSTVFDIGPSTVPGYAVLVNNSINSSISNSSFLSYLLQSSNCDGNNLVFLSCKPIPCGMRKVPLRSVGSYITNGDLAARGSWPWQVQIFESGKFICGGSVLNERWIVTAAHCLYNNSDPMHVKNPAVLVMKIGSTRLNSSDSDTQTFGAAVTIINPLYNDETVDYDSGLIKLNGFIKYTDVVQPICLVKPGMDDPKNFKVCVITGFGHTDFFTQPSQLLLQGRMNMMDKNTCIKAIQQSTHLGTALINSTINYMDMFCAGSFPTLNNINACPGDSGGPFSCQDINGKWTQVGIVSFSLTNRMDPKCSDSIFSRISVMYQWISDTVNVKCSFNV